MTRNEHLIRLLSSQGHIIQEFNASLELRNKFNQKQKLRYDNYGRTADDVTIIQDCYVMNAVLEFWNFLFM